MKKLLVVFVCIISIASLGGCKKEKQAEEPKTNVSVAEEKQEMEKPAEPAADPYEGMAKSPLTGEYIDEEAAKRRPFAVVINNLHKALPQSGIGQAGIYYEVLAEGEITRIVALFQDFDAEKIGPVRSARDYFTYFALDNDAFFIHHGGSETGYAAIRNRGLNSLDGMNGAGFWRDKARANTPGMYEHSSYTNAEELLSTVEAKGFNMELSEGYTPMFSFYEKETQLAGEAASAADIKLPYSGYQVSEFLYDSGERLYRRIQSGENQIDELTGETIAVKNVIIQEADMWVIQGDDAGRREVQLVGSGSGILATNGKAREITWKKDRYNSPTVWYDEKGEILKLNEGRTWVCVYPSNKEYTVE